MSLTLSHPVAPVLDRVAGVAFVAGTVLLAVAVAACATVATIDPAEPGLYVLAATFLGLPGALYLALSVLVRRRSPWARLLAAAATVIAVGAGGMAWLAMAHFEIPALLETRGIVATACVAATHAVVLCQMERACSLLRKRGPSTPWGFDAIL